MKHPRNEVSLSVGVFSFIVHKFVNSRTKKKKIDKIRIKLTELSPGGNETCLSYISLKALTTANYHTKLSMR